VLRTCWIILARSLVIFSCFVFSLAYLVTSLFWWITSTRSVAGRFFRSSRVSSPCMFVQVVQRRGVSHGHSAHGGRIDDHLLYFPFK
jgi:hypothetical protein